MDIKARKRYPEAMKIGRTTVGVAYMDEFKRPILYVRQGNEITKVASFTNEATAEWFTETMRIALWEAGVPFEEDDETEANRGAID